LATWQYFQVARELGIFQLSSDPVPRPGSAQIKLDVNAEPPWDPDPFATIVGPQKYFIRFPVMVPVVSLDSQDASVHQKAPHLARVERLDAYDDGCLNAVQELITTKALQDDKQPFFVMDMERVNGIVKEWSLKMPNVQPFYSMRCNSDQVLLQLLTKNTNVGLCCSSRFELALAMKHVGQERILYSNPLWTRANIRHAKQCGVKWVVIESEDDLKRFTTYFLEANIILRVVMDPRLTEKGLISMDSLNVEKAAELLRLAKNLPLSVRADAPSPAIFSYAVAQCRRLFDIAVEMGHEMSVLDVGDGFPSVTNAYGLSFEQVARALSAAVSLFFPQERFPHLRVIAEPGAYFASSPYLLVTRVVDKRLIDASLLTSDETDAGTVGYVYQINEGFYGAFGCRLITGRNPRCSPLIAFGEKLNTYAAVYGPTTCDTDVVLPLTRLPPLQVGDWLVWYDMGAYTMGNCETLKEGELRSAAIHYFENTGSR
uniref:Ornithine decarboxylase n=1 Tax=Gongylonema pulchrum TaxID=637853 RepID=A0A183E3T2_9BILA